METSQQPNEAVCGERLQRELAVAAAHHDRLAERVAALTKELVASELALADVEELRARVESLRTELDEARAESEAELQAAYLQIGNLTRELEAVHATVSWRITRVLRSVRRRSARPAQ